MRSEFVRSGSTLIYFCTLFLFCWQTTKAEKSEPREEGIWSAQQKEHELTGKHEKLLVESLRRITGFQQLEFSSNGALYLGEITPSVKSSLTARTILQQVLNAGSEVIIEDHSQSGSVTFGQLDEGTRYEDWGMDKQFLIWRVRIDFDDFRKMHASPEIQETFDPGITVLHEFLHSLGHKDPKNAGEIGECEEVINRVRTELGMALREQYHGDPLIQLPNQTIIVRVRFRERLKAQAAKILAPVRWKTHYLFFVMATTDESNSAFISLRK